MSAPKQHAKIAEFRRRAKAQIGTREIVGKKHNPKVVGWFAQVGHSWVNDDETPWCAAFIGAMLDDAGLPHTGKLNARSYLDWGVDVDIRDALPGDVVVFWRGSPKAATGHVADYEYHTPTLIGCLGGNQRNAVRVAEYDREQLLSIRRFPAPPAKGIAGALGAILAAILKHIFGKGKAK